jgi:AhpD family alkylhydroperoxidase
MSAITLIDESQAAPQVKELYKRIKDELGVAHVPAIFKAMAHVPTFLADTLENHIKIMGEGALDRRTKEMIALAVSAVNGCDYCVSVHSAIAQRIGLPESQVAETLALAATMSAHNHFQKFKDYSGDEFKPMRINMAEGVLKQKSLTDLQAELIFLCVSAVNGCSTCVKFHANKAKQAGATPAQFSEATAVMNLLIVYNNFVKSSGIAVDIKPAR